jgi:hypothetical protein
MFWLAYLFTVIVGGTFAVILGVLRKVLRNWGRLRIRNQKRARYADTSFAKNTGHIMC